MTERSISGGKFNNTRERKRNRDKKKFSDLNLTRILIGILNKDA